jgi:serine/threonine protein kinase/tetratricopeptide (TPR) repeat protein
MSLPKGSAFGSYEIVASLGAGGMGEVYRAYDRKLGRDVAFKVLPAAESGDPTASERLVREARTASRLNHPHICTVYDANLAEGHAYIAMELVEGETLSTILADGPLPADRVIRYATQLADALAHAHQRGIVHRDLKAANIVITPDGRAKILDFGLAKQLREHAESGTTVASLTGSGTIAGTTAYMAPEVLRGADVDTRSDIWSLGIVIFEMTTGRRPFTGGSIYELTSAILTAQVPPLPASVPRGLASIILSSLAKAPGERYQQAAEIRAALDAVGSSGEPHAVRPAPGHRSRVLALAAGGVALAALLVWLQFGTRVNRPAVSSPQVRAIAVLPLANLSGDASQDLFADGITEALITDLARVKGLDVISRTSAMQYRNSQKRLPQIARELTVDAIVQGSVMRAGDRVRVSAQLIDAATDRHLWADEYERDVRDVLSLQRDVARAIAREVRVTLTPQEEAGLVGGRRVSPAAHDLYLKARALIPRFNEPSIAEAIRLLEEALRIDAEFVEAWAALATAYAERGIWGNPSSSRDASARAHEAITRALALDPANAEAHASLGNVSLVYDWDWAGAERAMARSAELAPGDAYPRNMLASLMMALRRFPEAVAEAERYRRLDPASVRAISVVGRARYRAGQFDGAIEAFNEAIALDPSYGPNYARLADVYIALGRYDEALAWLDKGQRLLGATRRQTDSYAIAYALSGRRREAEAALRELIDRARTSDQTYYSIALVQTALGNHDAAFAWLNRAYDARSATLWLVNSEMKFDPLRNDPRFEDLLHRMKFPGH